MQKPSNFVRKAGGAGGFSWGQGYRQPGGGQPKSWAGWGQGDYGYWDDNVPIHDGTQVIEHDGYDRLLADRTVGNTGKVGQVIGPHKEDLPTVEALGRDLFWSLYKRNVKKQDVPLQDAYRVNEEIMREMMDTDEYLDLHATAQGDSFLADMAVGKVIGPILARLTSDTRERIKRQVEMEAQLAQLRARAATLQELHEANPSEKLRKGLEANTISLEELEKQIAELRGGLSEEERDELRNYLSGGLSQAAKEVGSVQAGFHALGGSMGGGGLAYAQGVTAAFGGSGGGNKRKMEIASKLLNDKKLRMIADLAGRMSEVAFQVQSTKSPDPTDELTDVRTGHDVARLLSSELLYLADEDLELVFYHRYANDLLMSYEIQGYTPQGRGPMVVMIDNSGSMSGEPEEWSKAVMLALRMIAEKQKRDFVVIHFDSYVQKVDEFPKGIAAPEKMLANIEFFSGGGTNFEPPMQEAMKKMRESRYKRADAIFITDGLCAIQDEECRAWNELRTKSGMRSYCILIGDDRYGRGVMEKLTDRLMVVNPANIMSENTADSEVLQTVFGV